jgi:hypothetical protein
LWGRKRRRIDFSFDWKKTIDEENHQPTSQEQQKQQSVSYQKVNIPWTDQIVKTGIELVFAIRSGQKVLAGVDRLFHFQLVYYIHTLTTAAETLIFFSILLFQQFWELESNKHKIQIASLSGSRTSKNWTFG